MTAHPATFTTILLPIFASLLPHTPLRILDLFAGTGKIALLHDALPNTRFFGAELEPEWSAMANTAGCPTPICSATNLPYPTATFDALVTSPCYGNRMADHHDARDASPRHTYRHVLGRPLHTLNAGALQWGDAYRALHAAAWTEARRVLRPGGILVLNVKDHIRGGIIQRVTNWHAVTLLGLGFVCTTRVHVPCPGQRHGANSQLRLAYESVLGFELVSA